ncbi:tetraacyldisaccharide 4'-kinase [Acidobacterium sp. S8]|uniref:tetraacyldisaccharide 4'-kinase n=1 Tax=Acidobacterium sp. S8 TaxID=1641854 RepID=UPI00131DB883|nr:tetraacyldisaccharide 4'-kinase [Acidobacterium sp. S8]
MIQRALLPLVPLYAAAIAAKNAAYDHGWAHPDKLRWPVISVGNISVGGSGKTPLVIALAKLFTQHKIHVDVLSRGYGRSSHAIERVDPAGSAERFGDEPLLIAQSAQVPVYVGASRYDAGRLAENEQSSTGVHLLDDGFQHRKLARNVNIAVVHSSDLRESLLPSGRLREPLSALRRASILVLREEDAELENQLAQRGIKKPVWWIRRSLTVRPDTGSVLPFCGIARPEEFFQSLRREAIAAVATHAFRDHHRYSERDMQQLITKARANSAQAFLTTEKDWVRLTPAQRDSLSAVAPLQIARLEAVLQNEAAAWSELERLLPAVFSRSL